LKQWYVFPRAVTAVGSAVIGFATFAHTSSHTVLEHPSYVLVAEHAYAVLVTFPVPH